MRLLLVVPLLALAIGGALGAPMPAAAATECSGTRTGTVKDSIVVRAGQTCTLTGTVVRGGVTIEPGATLYATDVEIRGALTGTDVFYVLVLGGSIRGNVTVSGSNLFAAVRDVEVRGNVTMTGASGYSSVAYSTVRGAVTLNGNSRAYAVGNQIDTDLSCADNDAVSNEDPDTLVPTPNNVGRSKLGQCAGL